MKPRKHAEWIHAYADGHNLEQRLSSLPSTPIGEWHGFDGAFKMDFEYRIKPEKKVIRYRRYLCKTDSDYIVGTLNYHEYVSIVLETMQLQNTFIRWIDTDWQEVEV